MTTPLKRRSIPKTEAKAVLRLTKALLGRDFKREGTNTYVLQEAARGDTTTYRILPDLSVNVMVRCWRASDGWSSDTMTARQALRHLTQS